MKRKKIKKNKMTIKTYKIEIIIMNNLKNK